MFQANEGIAVAASALLRVVDSEVRVIRDVERRLALTTAPKFSVFEFLRTDEMGLSACIAALLNPNGSHGQGASYLRLFLEEQECLASEGWFNRLDAARVAVETPANGMRRFDVEILLDGGRAVVIENKPWAIDQVLQLSDYALQLTRTCVADGWKLVYLSSGTPSEQSMPREELHRHQAAGSLKLMTFEALAHWLAKCGHQTKPISVRLFIEQMEQFVRKTLCGEADMTEAETIKDLVLQSPDNLRAALLVGSSITAVKSRLLLEGLKAPLQEALEKRGMRMHWEETLEAQRVWAGFGALPPDGSRGYVRFEFARSGLGGLFWGIYRTQPLVAGQTDDPGAEVLRQVLTGLFGRGGASPHWYWHSEDLRCLDSQGQAMRKDWQSDEVPWIGMHQQNLHEAFANLAERVYREIAGTPAGAFLAATNNLTVGAPAKLPT